MRQKIVVQDIKFDGERILVDADRLIAVGDIRSAFRLPLELKLGTVSRSAANPHGLLLERVISLKTEERKPDNE